MRKGIRRLCALVGALLLGGTSLRADFAMSRSRVWQDLPGSGLEGVTSAHDNYGAALAAGDFDGDGRDDLAAFDREDAASPNAGAVRVQYGGPLGLSPDDSLVVDFWPDVLISDAEAGDEFGIALAAGDFDGDGLADLAIGIPGEDAVLAPPPIAIETLNCGAVLVLYGSPGGISLDGVKILPTFGGDLTSARFGAALAAGDFDGDGFDDLAIGAPTAEVSGQEQAGFVAVYSGSAAGVSAVARRIDQDANDTTGAVSDAAEAFDRFGYALAVGNFNGDVDGTGGSPVMDLAISAPGEDSAAAGTESSGLVHLFYGSSTGAALGFHSDQAFDQSTVSASETIESFDSFGFALAAGDLDGDGRDDLAIAAPQEQLFVEGVGVPSAGAVSVLRGDFPFVVADGSGLTFDQSDLGIGEAPEANDLFGFVMAVDDFDRDGLADLVVAAPFEERDDPFGAKGEFSGAGAAYLIPGWTTVFPSPNRRPRTLAQHWDGHPGSLDNFDSHGLDLASGDFDGDGHPDLAIGASGETAHLDDGPLASAGAVFELRGALFADGFDRSLADRWSAAAP
jgi:hypothetical protein